MQIKEKIKQYPKIIVRAFIFNRQGELLLLKQANWKNKYACPGGKVEIGETLEEALVREVTGKTGLEIEDIKILEVVNGLGLTEKYEPGDEHFIFVDYTAKAKDPDKIKLNREFSKATWLSPADWLKRKKDLPRKYMVEAIEKIQGGEAKDYKDLYQRALADYQNLLKRTAQEKKDFIKYANEQMLYDIIPVYDHLKISFAHIDKSVRDNGWAEGLSYVLKQFRDVLQNMGVEEINTVGHEFDPHTMEAVEGKGKKVKKEIRPGYKLNGKTVIPAKVIME